MNDELKSLPEKVPGEHRWIVLAGYSVTEEQVKAAVNGEPVLLNSSMLYAHPQAGCTDCEKPYQDVVGQPCPADDTWKDIL